jgi:hypothetical protein
LGWAVESGIRSWQEMPAPFDSYRERATTLSTQHAYFTEQRNRIL